MTPLNDVDLVMLHEGLGSVSMWRDFPEQLARATGCRTLVYSRHGYGGSSPLDAPRRVDYMHEEARIWLPAILTRLGIRRPVLFGHSDGASIALIHAAGTKSEIAGIIALAPHVKVEDLTVRSIGASKAAYLETDLRAAAEPLPRRCRFSLLGLESDLARPGIPQLEHRGPARVDPLPHPGDSRGRRRIRDAGAGRQYRPRRARLESARPGCVPPFPASRSTAGRACCRQGIRQRRCMQCAASRP